MDVISHAAIIWIAIMVTFVLREVIWIRCALREQAEKEKR
jgi:hypothetical protein